MHDKRMETLSGLEKSCREFVGRTLAIRFVGGWGWTVNVDEENCRPYEDVEIVNGTRAGVVPSAFFSHEAALTRGFVGRIDEPGHLLHEQPVCAITMADGFDWNFTTRVTRLWRFWLGEGELICRAGCFPAVKGSWIIGGYGPVASTSPTLAPITYQAGR